MYGIVNKAIQGLVLDNYGEDVWNSIKEHSGLKLDSFFLANESYPDEVTYKLAGSAAEVLKISLDDVLISFGKYWVLKTGIESYGELMRAGGNTFKEFMINLPSFHDRVLLIYPKLKMPHFRMTDITDSSLNCHYYSERQGLKYFVFGLLQGLGEMFRTPLSISITQCREDGFDHEIFNITW